LDFPNKYSLFSLESLSQDFANSIRKQLLTQEADKQLLLAFTACKDGEMRTRIQAARLYGSEVPVKEITHLTGLPRRTIIRWYGRYLKQGLSGFVDNRQGGNHQYLTDEQIQDWTLAFLSQKHKTEP